MLNNNINIHFRDLVYKGLLVYTQTDTFRFLISLLLQVGANENPIFNTSEK